MAKVTLVTGGNSHNLPLRVTFRKQRGRKGARHLVRCGCCKESLEIYPAQDLKGSPHSESIEINGVHASVAQWRELLCPILGIEVPPIFEIPVHGSVNPIVSGD